MSLKALLVDDERLAREKLEEMLHATDRIQVIGKADSVGAAEQFLAHHKPDVVFLDIQMPGRTGFELLPKLPADTSVVFVTAYDAYAIRAFEVNAVDYLLKPVRQDRLNECLERLHEEETAEPEAPKSLDYDDHLFVKSAKCCKFIRVDTMTCLVADGPYSVLWDTDGNHMMVPRSLKQWEQLLPAKHFLRIHRSSMVNLNHIAHVEREGSNYRLWVKQREEALVMSRRHAALLKDRSV